MIGIILAAAVALICGASFGFVVGAVWQGRRLVDLLEENEDLNRRLDEHRRTRLPQAWWPDRPPSNIRAAADLPFNVVEVNPQPRSDAS